MEELSNNRAVKRVNYQDELIKDIQENISDIKQDLNDIARTSKEIGQIARELRELRDTAFETHEESYWYVMSDSTAGALAITGVCITPLIILLLPVFYTLA